jgi:predicted RNase H-like HicB family nuclease
MEFTSRELAPVRPKTLDETIESMKRPFAATVWREGNWYVSQCLEIDIASQGESEEEALVNLAEAIELHYEAPQATRPPKVRTIEVEVGAA